MKITEKQQQQILDIKPDFKINLVDWIWVGSHRCIIDERTNRIIIRLSDARIASSTVDHFPDYFTNWYESKGLLTRSDRWDRGIISSDIEFENFVNFLRSENAPIMALR